MFTFPRHPEIGVTSYAKMVYFSESISAVDLKRMLTYIPSNTGLSPREVDILGTKYHIYMPPNGRMNIAGLNVLSMPVVAAALDAVVRGL